MIWLKPGKMYRYMEDNWLQKDETLDMSAYGENTVPFLSQIKKQDIVLFIEASQRTPFLFKVIHNDVVGWILTPQEVFEELENEDKEQETGEEHPSSGSAGVR